MRTEDFVYELPAAAIAQEPAEPRDSARLLDTRDHTDHTFRDLPGLLDGGDLLIVNETRVMKARLVGERADTGGKVELLLLDEGEDGSWECLARPSRRLRPGIVLRFGVDEATVVSGPDRGSVGVSFADDVMEILERSGEMPLPPYFEGELSDPGRYQTVFAATPGSAAAPTAGLHFTNGLLADLAESEVKIARIDLHVGVDTFRPITTSLVDEHVMHSEWCRVPPETAAAIVEARAGGGRVVAVGTTSMRALESMGRPDGTVAAGAMDTDLFLRPGSSFNVVDALITNFHVPGSTLVVLLAAFMGPGWRDSYSIALDRGYRFLSFGDAMYCEKASSG